MKKRILKNAIVAAGVLCVGVTLAMVLRPAAPQKGAFDTLAGVSALEAPQVAARLVSEAPLDQQPAVAREVLEKVSALSQPGVTPFALSAICQAAPNVAADAVGAAIALQPDETLALTRAALTAAPAQTEAIVAAACRTLPQAYASVAVLAAEQTPAAKPQILKAVASALPVIAPQVEQAQVYCADASMTEVMRKTHELATIAYRERAADAQRQAIARTPDQTAPSAAPVASSLASLTPFQEMANLDSTRAPGATLGNGLTAASASEMPYLNPPAGPPSGPPAGPPRVGPPFTPRSGTSTEVKADDGTVLPPSSGRDYSAP